jgi:hypothetical protein
MLVRGSETVCDVRGVLILHEDVAKLPRRVVARQEEDEGDGLLFNRETVRGPFSVGLGCVVGFLRGCCWAAEVHGGKPGKFSLHFHFSIFKFSVFFFCFYLLV